MQCPGCSARNEPDAAFCSECGAPFHQATATAPAHTKPRKAYLIMVALVPVLALVAGIGYYKFFLPEGVVAFVNNEKIPLSELDDAVSRTLGKGSAVPDGLRYRILNQLISERIAMQEARKAGISVSREEVSIAALEAQAASGLNDKSFNQEMSALYGGMSAFETALERRLLIRKLIAEHIASSGLDPASARRATDEWMRDAAARSTVRIALAEQIAGPGCRCCGERTVQDRQEKNTFVQDGAVNRSEASSRMETARDTALRYWRVNHGPDAVETRQRDYGCHIQVDIIRQEKKIASLRYQNGIITEE